ncbi:radical SAM protein [Candidatus Woesearchaeota archaeon]|nr:radical SAM protein [Candidatus Woesearchaeota archaeon]
MELLARKKGDRIFTDYSALEREVKKKSLEDIGILIYYAFNWRTRIGPFVGADLFMANSGVRDVAGALYSAGLKNIRVVLGTWNPNFDFRHAKLEGKIPEVFGIGSLQINSADAYQKIFQALSLEANRPLIIGGGPHAIYAPWKYFNLGGKVENGVDIVVKGEQNVTLQLMNVLLEYRTKKGSMLEAFYSARKDNAIFDIPGLMYIAEDRSHLIDTGVPQLIGNYDELPLEIIGLSLLESKHKNKGLDCYPAQLDRLSKNGLKSVSTLMSRGCNLRCSYCPIPAQQQFTLRSKSPERIITDLTTIIARTGITSFFGTDDNAAFSRENLEKQYGIMANADLGNKIFYGTEMTEGQLWINRDLIPLLRKGGLRAIWFGIEDLTKTLVKKGQSVEKTEELFGLLNKNGIYPMPMLMHYDGQKFTGDEKNLGLQDQIEFLRSCGAKTMQVTYLSPSTGSKDEDRDFLSGKVFRKIGSLVIEDRHFDGTHVVSTDEADVLERQRNIINAYRSFYNAKNFIRELVASFSRGEAFSKYNPAWFQLRGIMAAKATKRGLKEYMDALGTGEFERYDSPPTSQISIKTVLKN